MIRSCNKIVTVILCWVLACMCLQPVAAMFSLQEQTLRSLLEQKQTIHLVTENKKTKKTSSIQPILKELRAGASKPKTVLKKASFWDKALSPRTVLKLCTFGIVPFSLVELVKPHDFVNFFYNMKGSVSTTGTELLIFMNAIHLLCIAVSSWAIANEGTDKLCRYMMTAILFCCSIPQCFWYVTKDCLNPGRIVFTSVFQGGFFLYLSIAALKAWF